MLPIHVTNIIIIWNIVSILIIFFGKNFTAISFTAIFDSGCLGWGWDGWKRIKSRLRRKKTAPVGVGVGGCVGVSIEGRAQNIAPLQVGG